MCAAGGCPVLENRAFFPQELDDRLDSAASDFILNPDKVRLDREENVLYLSSILKWYQEDFPSSQSTDPYLRKYSQKQKGVVEFVSRFLSEEDRLFIIQQKPRIKYLSYDWGLNELQ